MYDKGSLHRMNNKSTTTPVTGAANTADLAKTLMSPMWEPKTQNRFMVHIINDKKKHIIEPYLVKYIDRPGYTTVGKERVWNPIKLRIYEPIVPEHTLFRCIGAGAFDIQVHELGPVGDIVETWHIPHCHFSAVKSKPLDWTSNGDHQEIECELEWQEIIVKNGDSEFKIRREK